MSFNPTLGLILTLESKEITVDYEPFNPTLGLILTSRSF